MDSAKKSLGLLLVILVWVLADYSRIFESSLWFASPMLVLNSIFEIFTTQQSELIHTLMRVIISSIIVLFCGIVSGFIFGYFENLYAYIEGFIDFWRSIPPILVLSIFFFLDAKGDPPRIALVFFACYPIILMQIAESLKNIPDERKDFIEHIGANFLFKSRHILFYEIMPSFFICIRTVVSLSFIIIIVTEMVRRADIGIGYGINKYDGADNAKENIYAYAIVIGALGFCFNTIIRFIEKKFFEWEK
jgi:ABC-type nitrate/sulfonate/bicarbonate transport system permease component